MSANKVVSLTVLVLLSIVSLTGTGSASSAPATQFVGAKEETIAKLQSKISSSISSNKWPAIMSPSLKDLLTKDKFGNPGTYVNQGTSLVANCKGSNSEYKFETPVPCFFGDLKSKITYVLWGDSSAGSWLPAVAGAASLMKVRIAVLVAHGCGLSNWTPPGTTFNSGCEQWRNALPKVIGSLKPKAIIASTLGMGVYSNADVASIAVAWQTTFQKLTKQSPNAVRIFLGSTPVSNKGRSLVSCLSTQNNGLGFNKALLACSPPADGWPLKLMQDSNKVSAQASNAVLVDTLPWFCDMRNAMKISCPIVIGSNLVYVDADHLSNAYTKTLAQPLKEALSQIK